MTLGRGQMVLESGGVHRPENRPLKRPLAERVRDPLGNLEAVGEPDDR
jgi:hypothetical protein